MCAAPKNNQFWKLRSKHGRDKIFESPKYLWDAACEYFEWCESNPIKANQPVKAGDHFGEYVELPMHRPFTISGLLVFLDVDENTFERYCKDKEYKDFWDISNKIKRIIYTQKFEGASVGIFNASIIARDLGLVDKKENEIRGGINLHFDADDKEA